MAVIAETKLNNNSLFSFISLSYNLRRNSRQVRYNFTNKQNNLQWSNIFFNRVTKIWNDLPDNVVTAPSLPSFKFRLNLIKHHLKLVLICFVIASSIVHVPFAYVHITSFPCLRFFLSCFYPFVCNFSSFAISAAGGIPAAMLACQ